jgi:non-homologous end joining protein Ku
MPAARPSWKGFIRFSMVSIPVQGYTAARSDTDGGNAVLNQLHEGCNARVKYQKVCPIHGHLPMPCGRTIADNVRLWYISSPHRWGSP